MAARPRWRDWPAYLAARAGLLAMRRLPLPWAAALGSAVMAAVARLIPSRRRLAEKQVRFALGASAEEAGRIVRKTYRHIGAMVAEIARAGELRPETLERHIDFRDTVAVCRSLLAEGRGLLILTGHLGNWELGSLAARGFGVDSATVARPLDNPLLNRLVNGWRETLGMRVHGKGGAMRPALRQLRKGGMFSFLVDQDAGPRGVFVPLFGRTASTMPEAAELAMRTGAPILVQAMFRDGDRPMRFVFRRGEPIRPCVGAADPQAEILRILTHVHRDLEMLIRAAPEQWFWLHRRWKTRPPGEAEAETETSDMPARKARKRPIP